MQARSTGAVRQFHRRSVVTAATVAALGTAGAAASAQTIVNWTDLTPGGASYIVGANWSGAAAPTAADIANINNTGRALLGGTDAGVADILNLGVQPGEIGHLTIDNSATLNL